MVAIKYVILVETGCETQLFVGAKNTKHILERFIVKIRPSQLNLKLVSNLNLVQKLKFLNIINTVKIFTFPPPKN